MFNELLRLMHFGSRKQFQMVQASGTESIVLFETLFSSEVACSGKNRSSAQRIDAVRLLLGSLILSSLAE